MMHVYTGNGKGKTTAAIGLAIRAIGRGKRVRIVQFMKKGEYGELMALKKLGIDVDVEQFGRAEFVNKDNPEREDITLAEKALKRAEELLLDCDLLILDEINVAIDYNLIALGAVLELMEKAKDKEVVLTGRYAGDEIIDKADYVTEMKEIKHPYRRGIEGREGIEF